LVYSHKAIRWCVGGQLAAPGIRWGPAEGLCAQKPTSVANQTQTPTPHHGWLVEAGKETQKVALLSNLTPFDGGRKKTLSNTPQDGGQGGGGRRRGGGLWYQNRQVCLTAPEEGRGGVVPMKKGECVFGGFQKTENPKTPIRRECGVGRETG